MKVFYSTVVFSVFLLGSLHAQMQFDQFAAGASYSEQTYYRISDGSSTSVDHTVWDIAFSVQPQQLGIFINEAVATSMSTPLPETELYLTTSTEFETADTSGMQRILNQEINWEGGAFNHVRNEADPFDFGWGSYNVSNHQVIGSRIFVIHLRNGAFKKLMIESLISGVYSFKYANLDGSDEVTETIAKADFSEKTLVYYSIENQEILDLEPVQWDLLFTRYYTTLDDGNGGALDYLVTGILSNAGVQIAQADNIDPETVQFTDFENSLTDTLTQIGHDWKFFDLATFQWGIVPNRVYFVQTEDAEVWQLQFFDFEGSSTGVATIGKTFVTTVTSNEEISAQTIEWKVFPNPARSDIQFQLSLNAPQNQAQATLFNAMGQLIWQEPISVQQGLNTYSWAVDHLPKGRYHLQVQLQTETIQETIIIQ